MYSVYYYMKMLNTSFQENQQFDDNHVLCGGPTDRLAYVGYDNYYHYVI